MWLSDEQKRDFYFAYTSGGKLFADMAPPRVKMEITDSDPAFLSSVGMKWSEPETPLALAREKIAELESDRHRRINQKSYEELMAELANPDTFDGAD